MINSPDCSICFNALWPTQAIWTCTPTPPSLLGNDIDDETMGGRLPAAGGGKDCCWSLFHRTLTLGIARCGKLIRIDYQ